MTRRAPVDGHLAVINDRLKIPGAHPVTAVTIDGHEEGSTILLIRRGARDVAITGTLALNSAVRLQAAVQAATHVWCPKLDADAMRQLIEAVYAVAETRSIYDSVSSAHNWGTAYLLTCPDDGPLNIADTKAQWDRFVTLALHEELARLEDHVPQPRVIWLAGEHDGKGLVIRPWFHEFVKEIAKEPGLSEQRISTLMSRTGWEKWPSSRSAITAHDPADNKLTRQFRFYVVPAGWLDDADQGLLEAPDPVSQEVSE